MCCKGKSSCCTIEILGWPYSSSLIKTIYRRWFLWHYLSRNRQWGNPQLFYFYSVGDQSTILASFMFGLWKGIYHESNQMRRGSSDKTKDKRNRSMPQRSRFTIYFFLLLTRDLHHDLWPWLYSRHTFYIVFVP